MKIALETSSNRSDVCVCVWVMSINWFLLFFLCFFLSLLVYLGGSENWRKKKKKENLTRCEIYLTALNYEIKVTQQEFINFLVSNFLLLCHNFVFLTSFPFVQTCTSTSKDIVDTGCLISWHKVCVLEETWKMFESFECRDDDGGNVGEEIIKISARNDEDFHKN